jgi:hypothetical protein
MYVRLKPDNNDFRNRLSGESLTYAFPKTLSTRSGGEARMLTQVAPDGTPTSARWLLVKERERQFQAVFRNRRARELPR